MVFSGVANQLKYHFVVKPGADPSVIQLLYHGADSVNVNSAGQLEVHTQLGDLKDDKPTAYQESNSEVADVDVAYDLQPSEGGGSYQYGFKLANYDRSLPLIIDPAILVYSSFLGGSGDDRGNAIAVDGDGNAYITGETNSLESSFPGGVGPDLSFNGTVDAFVAKVNAAGTALIYAGFIGGTGDDRGKAIAVDSAGDRLAGSPLVTYLRYNLELSPGVVGGLKSGLSDKQVEELAAMDEPLNMGVLHELGTIDADRSVKPEDFPTRFDLS